MVAFPCGLRTLSCITDLAKTEVRHCQGTLSPGPCIAGFKVDSLKLAVPAGERKSLTITFSAPQQPKPGSLAALGISEEVIGTLMGTLKGGVPPPKTAAGRRISLSLTCQLCKK